MRDLSSQQNSSPDLPPPDGDALVHSQKLEAHIRQVIEQSGGWISFARFMELALYAPGLGYYSAGAAKLGKEGDFVTAPEISSLFSCCLAGQVCEALEQIGGGDVLELGAGSGAMAADILRQMARQDCLPGEYLILEVSADLRRRQQQFLAEAAPELARRVRWLDALPEQFDGVIVANEVMDALPVERIRLAPEGLLVQGVVVSDGGFAWQDRPAGDGLIADWEAVCADLPQKPDPGFESELCRQLGPWVGALADSLRRGVILLIDYGLPRSQYYHPDRSDGTLLCHYRHRAHPDPLRFAGIQDITAWVDFTRAAEAAVDNDLEIMGFSTQAHFLMAAGLQRLLEQSPAGPTQQSLDLAGQVRKLTLPGEMGERFKVIGLSRGMDRCLSGFGMRDLTHTL